MGEWVEWEECVGERRECEGKWGEWKEWVDERREWIDEWEEWADEYWAGES